MPTDVTIPLLCRCGAVRGSVDGSGGGLRVICYCDDCRAYAHALGRADVLDAHGGTDLWQTAPARVSLSTGREHVRCLRLSDRGMLRWHTVCCSTPIGNSMPSARVPFVGIVHAMMDHRALDRDAALGPPARVQGRFALGGVPPGAHARASLGVIARSLALLLRGGLRRAHRPTPFFDATGRPIVEPRVLSTAERAALRTVGGASS